MGGERVVLGRVRLRRGFEMEKVTSRRMCFFNQQLDGDVEKVDSMNNDLDVDKQQCEMVGRC